MDVRTISTSASSTSQCGKRSSVSSSTIRAFEPGEVRAEAEVDAVAERDVAVEGALDVEAIGIDELALVAAGAAGEHGELRVLRARVWPCHSTSRVDEAGLDR